MTRPRFIGKKTFPYPGDRDGSFASACAGIAFPRERRDVTLPAHGDDLISPRIAFLFGQRLRQLYSAVAAAGAGLRCDCLRRAPAMPFLKRGILYCSCPIGAGAGFTRPFPACRGRLYQPPAKKLYHFYGLFIWSDFQTKDKRTL